ncbi:hypothetical protein DENSPDRAFT_886523 [Dentipellis sp. KUC8613]|nr:hypothetical protein DENSPDRAFT_886523 [Dentipellis sp. KUC8613]
MTSFGNSRESALPLPSFCAQPFRAPALLSLARAALFGLHSPLCHTPTALADGPLAPTACHLRPPSLSLCAACSLAPAALTGPRTILPFPWTVVPRAPCSRSRSQHRHTPVCAAVAPPLRRRLRRRRAAVCAALAPFALPSHRLAPSHPFASLTRPFRALAQSWRVLLPLVRSRAALVPPPPRPLHVAVPPLVPPPCAVSCRLCAAFAPPSSRRHRTALAAAPSRPSSRPSAPSRAGRPCAAAAPPSPRRLECLACRRRASSFPIAPPPSRCHPAPRPTPRPTPLRRLAPGRPCAATARLCHDVSRRLACLAHRRCPCLRPIAPPSRPLSRPFAPSRAHHHRLVSAMALARPTAALGTLSHPPTPSRTSDRRHSHPTATLAARSRPPLPSFARSCPTAGLLALSCPPTPSRALGHRRLRPLVPTAGLAALSRPVMPSRAPGRRRSRPPHARQPSSLVFSSHARPLSHSPPPSHTPPSLSRSMPPSLAFSNPMRLIAPFSSPSRLSCVRASSSCYSRALVVPRALTSSSRPRVVTPLCPPHAVAHVSLASHPRARPTRLARAFVAPFSCPRARTPSSCPRPRLGRPAYALAVSACRALFGPSRRSRAVVGPVCHCARAPSLLPCRALVVPLSLAYP